MATVATANKQKQGDDALTDVATLIGIPVLAAGMIAIAALVGAWVAFVLSKLYNWFVVPLGAPAANWWHIWGLFLMVNLLTLGRTAEESDAKKSLSRGIGRIIGAAFVLLIGWLIHGQI